MRVVLIVACTTVLGTVIGLMIAVRTPPKYQCRAKIEHPDFAAHPPALSPLRVDLVTRELDLENRWATTFDQATATISSAVVLKPDPQGLVIVVTLPDAKEARLIARTLAEGLGTPAYEKTLATKWPRLGDVNEADRNDLDSLSRLEWLLADQAQAAGFPSYGAALRKASEGDANAVELVQGEDFSRRWAMLQEISRKIGLHDSTGAVLLPPDAKVEIEPIPAEPTAKTGRIILETSRFGGLAVGGLLVLALMRWKPDFLRPEPPAGHLPATNPPAARPAVPDSNDDPW